MEDALKVMDNLIERIEYGDITRNQIIGKLVEIKEYLEI